MRRLTVVAPDWQQDRNLTELLDELPHIKEARITRRLKDKAASLVARIQVGEQELVIKQYRTHTPLRRLNRALRRSKAYRSWWACEQMARIGVPAMKNVAYFEYRLGPLQFDPIFIGSLVDGPNLIEHLSREDLSDGQWQADARQVIRRVQSIHAAGLVHGDLNWTNIRFTPEGASFVDLDDMRAHRLPARRHHRMLRDWRVLLYNWRERPTIQARFEAVMEELLGSARLREIQSKRFRT